MKLTKTEEFKKYLKTAGLGFLCIFLYFFIPTIEKIFLYSIDYNSQPISIKATCLIIWYIITICAIMLILNKKISKDIKDMKKNHKKYFEKYFKYYLIALGIMMISNLIINGINHNIASNENSLREMFEISPFYTFFSCVIYAPIVEELIFRQSIRNIIPNKKIFIIVSGLIFGSLHVLTSNPSPIEYLYLIPYCAPGFAFAYILANSDNICVPASLHFMHNGVLMSLQFLILFF